MSENKKDIEIISGDGSNLDISQVYDHLISGKPKFEKDKPKNIVIPNVKKINTDEKEKNKDCEDKKDADSENEENK